MHFLAMKKLIFLFLLTLLYTGMQAQNENPDFDQQLADSLGADELGMRNYYLVILKTGSSTLEDKDRLNTIFRGHFDFIKQMITEGKLIIAGPLGKNDKSYRGIYIFTLSTKDEVEILLQSDLSVKEKIFDYEIYPWYGSAALPTYLDTHKKIEKKKL